MVLLWLRECLAYDFLWSIFSICDKYSFKAGRILLILPACFYYYPRKHSISFRVLSSSSSRATRTVPLVAYKTPLPPRNTWVIGYVLPFLSAIYISILLSFSFRQSPMILSKTILLSITFRYFIQKYKLIIWISNI